MFSLERFCYIEVLFYILYYHWGNAPINVMPAGGGGAGEAGHGLGI